MIKARTLDSIINEEKISSIDYLTIDVEGNELGVLKTINLQTIPVKLISVESNDRESVSRYLSIYGYKFIQKICADDFYARI